MLRALCVLSSCKTSASWVPFSIHYSLAVLSLPVLPFVVVLVVVFVFVAQHEA